MPTSFLMCPKSLFRLRKTTTLGGAVGTALGARRGWCPQACLGTAGPRQLRRGSCWDCGAALGVPSLRNMVFYLRQITLSIKTDDSVYAKRPLVKTPLLHPCREAPPWRPHFPRPQKEKCVSCTRNAQFLLKDLLGLTPKAAAGHGLSQDFSGVFGKLLFRLRKTTTFETVNSNIH